MLHGRGSTGQEFAEELFAAKLSTKNETLRSRFPSHRWGFPSSREIWSTAFQENMPTWFEAHSLTDISARSELQIPGIQESVRYIRSILDEEIERLQNNSANVIIGGISQGAATGLWTLLSETRLLGGFFGASCWLPFCQDVIRYLEGERPNNGANISGNEVGLKFVDSTIVLRTPNNAGLFPLSPIFLGHGIDDAYVDVELGRAAKEALTKAGYATEWAEYEGADEEGHWLKEPEQINDIASFLERVDQEQR
jgi:lysophospholipase II